MTRPDIALHTDWRFLIPDQDQGAHGLSLSRCQLPGQHLAAVELVLPAPLEAEPRQCEGVATISAQASLEATTVLPDLVEQLELHGAAVASTAAWGTTRISASAPTWRLPAVMGLVAAAVKQPAFHVDDLSHHVEAQVAAYATRMASPAAVTQQALRTALYGDHNREGRPLAGTPETLSAIDRMAVEAWHRECWQPQGATLVIAGDLDGLSHEELMAAWEDWQPGTAPAPLTETEPQQPQLLLVDLPQAAQTTVRVAAPTPGRHHPDWAALRLGSHAMCGAFASRLNVELRERLGYTYGVSGGISPRRIAGTFHVGTALNTDTAADAVARLLAGLALEKEFTTEEITDAAKYLLLAGPLNFETAADIARQVASLAAVGIHPSYVNRYREALGTTSVEQVNQAWRRHLNPQRLTVVIGGPARVLEPQLRARGIPITVADTTTGLSQ